MMKTKLFLMFMLLMLFVVVAGISAQGSEEGVEVETWVFDSSEQLDEWRAEQGMPDTPREVIELDAVHDCSFGEIEIDPSTAGPLTANSSVIEAYMRYCPKTNEFWLAFGANYAGHDNHEIRLDANLEGENEAGIPKHLLAWNANYVPEADGALFIHQVIDSAANGEMYHFVLQVSLQDTETNQGPIVDFSWWLRQEKFWVYFPGVFNQQGLSCPHIFHQSGDRPIDGGISVGIGPDRALRFWVVDEDRSWNAATVEVYEYLQGETPRELLHENIRCENGLCESTPIVGTPQDPRPRAGAQVIATFQLYPDNGASNCSKTVYADPPFEEMSMSQYLEMFQQSRLTFAMHDDYDFSLNR